MDNITEIILNKGEKLEDKVYINKKIKITCLGNNIIKNCIFNNIINNYFICIDGKGVEIISNQFIEIIHDKLFYNLYKTLFYSNLFLKCKLNINIKFNQTIFHKNRIENSTGFINFNSYHNRIINNEIINNKDFQLVFNKDRNLICFNDFDYKSTKKSIAIIINGKNNIIKGNKFLNIDYPIKLFETENKIFDNDFFNSKIIFSLDCLEDCVILDLVIENNNLIQNKKIFNKKKFLNSIINTNNINDEELLKRVIEIKDVEKEIDIIKNKRFIRKKKEIKKEKEIKNDLDKDTMIKLLKINEMLNEVNNLSENLKKFIKIINNNIKKI